MSVRPPMMIGDVVSGGAIIFSWINVFTGTVTPLIALVASFVAMVFYGIQIYESDFVRNWLEIRRRNRIAKLTIEIAALEAKARVTATAREVLRADTKGPATGRGDSA